MSRSLELLTDACVGLPVTPRKMFGGHGFFAPNGGMFACIVTDDEVIFKLVMGPLRDELISLGGKPWVYQGRDKAMEAHVANVTKDELDGWEKQVAGSGAFKGSRRAAALLQSRRK